MQVGVPGAIPKGACNGMKGRIGQHRTESTCWGENAAGIHNWPRPLGPGLQYPGCSVDMHGVASHPSHLHHGAAHYPLPCKTSAHKADAPRCLGIANMRGNGREKRAPRMRRWLSDLARDGPSRSGTASGRSCKMHRWPRGAGRLRMPRICPRDFHSPWVLGKKGSRWIFK